MKCPHCEQEVENNLSKCPYCNTNLALDLDFELPKLKADEPSVLVLSKKELNENKIVVDAPEEITEEIFSSEKNIKKRKFFFVKTFLITMILSISILGVCYSLRKDEPEEISITSLLENYYNSYSSSDADKLLKSIKNDEELVLEVQSKTKEKYIKDISEFSDKIYENRSTLLNKVDNYTEEIKQLHAKYSVDDEEVDIRVLNDTDFNYLNNTLDKISKDSEALYTAINIYKQKQYNDAAYNLNLITKENYYYEEAQKQLDLCTKDVLVLLNNDINKMLENINTLTEQEQHNRYLQIYSVINNYGDIYSNVKLENNERYQELLNKYRTN